MKKFYLIIILSLTSCMKLYSYPTSGNERMAIHNTNSQMRPNFQQPVMPVTAPKPQIPESPLAPNSIKKYPNNVPYPYGMKKRYKSIDDSDKAIKELEGLSKQQYKGGYHYRSTQSSQYLDE
jgi:hypothetical protein